MITRLVSLVLLALVLAAFGGFVDAQEDTGSAPADNAALVMNWLAALSAQPAAQTVRLTSGEDDFLKGHLAQLANAFPGFQITVEDVVAEGDTVAVRALFHGVQQGEFAGQPATGHLIQIPITLFLQIENGEITGRWMQTDLQSLVQQLQTAAVMQETTTISDRPPLGCESGQTVKHGM